MSEAMDCVKAHLLLQLLNVLLPVLILLRNFSVHTDDISILGFISQNMHFLNRLKY